MYLSALKNEIASEYIKTPGQGSRTIASAILYAEHMISSIEKYPQLDWPFCVESVYKACETLGIEGKQELLEIIYENN